MDAEKVEEGQGIQILQFMQEKEINKNNFN